MSGTLPPGPRDGRLAGTVAFHRDPLTYLQRAQADFGDVFSMRLVTTGPFVVVADPGLAATVVTADPARARAGAARRRMLPMASPLSVFAGDGAEHDAARRRVAQAFGTESIAAITPSMVQIAGRHVARWPQHRPFRLLPRMRLLADEIFVREILGVRDSHRAPAPARSDRRAARA